MRFDPPATATPAGAWSRYFARILDLVLEIFVVGAAMAALEVDPFANVRPAGLADFLSGLVVTPLALAIDAVVLALFGTTPGKALFGIRVRGFEGRKLSFGQAILRNLGMWFFGLGLGIPIVTVVTLIVSARKLWARDQVVWDDLGGFDVTQDGVGNLRIAIGILVSASLLSAAMVLGTGM